jgi:16S rRNA (guanine527-N7)-methyltransferase
MHQASQSQLQEFWRRCGLPEGQWPAARERFQQYWRLIETHNASAGLMGEVSQEDFHLKHLADSLAVLAVYPWMLSSPGPLADVGSGAGLPGLVLAIALPQLQVTAIESNHRKSRFAALAAQALGLADRVEVICRRSRELGHREEYRGRFSIVTARAVAAADRLIRDCRLLLASGGSAIFYKTPPAVDEELPRARREAGKHGLEIETSSTVLLPGQAGQRQFIRIVRPK